MFTRPSKKKPEETPKVIIPNAVDRLDEVLKLSLKIAEEKSSSSTPLTPQLAIMSQAEKEKIARDWAQDVTLMHINKDGTTCMHRGRQMIPSEMYNGIYEKTLTLFPSAPTVTHTEVMLDKTELGFKNTP